MWGMWREGFADSLEFCPVLYLWTPGQWLQTVLNHLFLRGLTKKAAIHLSTCLKRSFADTPNSTSETVFVYLPHESWGDSKAVGGVSHFCRDFFFIIIFDELWSSCCNFCKHSLLNVAVVWVKDFQIFGVFFYKPCARGSRRDSRPDSSLLQRCLCDLRTHVCIFACD